MRPGGTGLKSSSGNSKTSKSAELNAQWGSEKKKLAGVRSSRSELDQARPNSTSCSAAAILAGR